MSVAHRRYPVAPSKRTEEYSYIHVTIRAVFDSYSPAMHGNTAAIVGRNGNNHGNPHTSSNSSRQQKKKRSVPGAHGHHSPCPPTCLHTAKSLVTPLFSPPLLQAQPSSLTTPSVSLRPRTLRPHQPRLALSAQTHASASRPPPACNGAIATHAPPPPPPARPTTAPGQQKQCVRACVRVCVRC
ncbi:uncharacterized protein K452DRAFT_284748 [Aplosporella prunicola CBS 121167]|uniref:Uncharacterized protein n=1 Tax=Aplosporella prunicola CBS 121167 TaxID=1176127 RepID=A0A6A6BJY6_9PEZI|nr:uncharacterized protein K452DRAFT_284748 [Aplosporella prunicola CBS 121167]KAF2144429.1 hypothetical protein K452DRAFT_284748 [Aplosporella prunicola CBS 121167]